MTPTEELANRIATRLLNEAGVGARGDKQIAAIILSELPSERCQHLAERDALGEAIAQAAIKRGIIDGKQPLTGPELLMLCQDLATLPSERDAGLSAMIVAKQIQDAVNDDPRMLDDQVALAGIISRARVTSPDGKEKSNGTRTERT